MFIECLLIADYEFGFRIWLRFSLQIEKGVYALPQNLQPRCLRNLWLRFSITVGTFKSLTQMFTNSLILGRGCRRWSRGRWVPGCGGVRWSRRWWWLKWRFLVQICRVFIPFVVVRPYGSIPIPLSNLLLLSMWFFSLRLLLLDSL